MCSVSYLYYVSRSKIEIDHQSFISNIFYTTSGVRTNVTSLFNANGVTKVRMLNVCERRHQSLMRHTALLKGLL